MGIMLRVKTLGFEGTVVSRAQGIGRWGFNSV